MEKIVSLFLQRSFQSSKRGDNIKVKSKLKVPKLALNEYIKKVASDVNGTVPLGN